MDTVSYLTINGETREIADNQNREEVNDIKNRLDLLELTIGGISDFNINNYKQLSFIAKKGNASEYINIGDQVIVPWKPNEDDSIYNLPFDVVGINIPIVDRYNRIISNNVWLQSHYGLTSIPFSGANAFYIPAETMNAGTYYFTINVSVGSLTSGNSYNFTITQNVPAGGQLVFNNITSSLNSIKIQTYMNGLDSNPIEEVSLISGQNGINLGELNNLNEYSTTGMNDINRIRYGYNRYKYSTVRQWCNSADEKNNWWEPLNPFERCPSVVSSTRGFIAGLPTDFLEIINPIQVTTLLNTVSDNELGIFETTLDYFFLPSIAQIVEESNYSIEGIRLPYWTNKPNNSDRVHYFYNKNNTSTSVWLRSLLKTNDRQARYISSGGNISSSTNCINAYSLTPMCVIY